MGARGAVPFVAKLINLNLNVFTNERTLIPYAIFPSRSYYWLQHISVLASWSNIGLYV
jgi:hypothetical protein